ncbi:hypothetical protein [Sphingomonas sp. 8AM]|uniref:hypothetical protein n=1 Tax=Sphingomonas sp. 8AM TaxID=2653170 RepID=UPI0012F25E54|nr:hypothetical protein [Sphingomonas sp. 8AM]VXD00418.1 conserved exported hypothetical protein [Sphingomonas sp. 8AM]
MRILFIVPALLVAVVPGPATAQAAPPAPLVPSGPFGAATPVDNAQLGAVTGQSDLSQVIRAQNTGTVSGNSVNGHSETGTISFDPSSFQNLNGLSLLSANTGNNVSINSSLNVNVAINR